VTSVSHLGERVTALVDGQLSIDATERAHAHLAGCRQCRDAVEAERVMKARLAGLTGPAPDAALLGRLLAMGGPSGPLPPRNGHVPGTPRPRAVPPRAVLARSRPGHVAPGHPVPGRMPVAARVRPSGRRPLRPGWPHPGAGRVAGRPVGHGADRRRRVRLAGAVLGALGVVGAGVAGLALAGPPTAVSGAARPQLDSFTITQRDGGRLPFTDQSGGAVQTQPVLAGTTRLGLRSKP
jgi:hypothetical protein